MATKYPISKAEFKKRVRMVYEAWPPELLVANVRGCEPHPGCIMQVALETDAFNAGEMACMVDGVNGSVLADIAKKHDAHEFAEALAAVEAL